MSACLVAVMTVWATSSPFSPLSQQPAVETAQEPSLMLQRVKDAFALSESVLPSPTSKVEVTQVQSVSPPTQAETTTDVIEQVDFGKIDSGKLAQLERTHARQEEDRSAWLSFKRQQPLLMTEPIARVSELSLKEGATDLPEVHFASGDPLQLPMQLQVEADGQVDIDGPLLEIVPRLPPQSVVVVDNSSELMNEKVEAVRPLGIEASQPTARVATLPLSDNYIAPFGNNTTTVPPTLSPVVPEIRSWETGRY